jgi:hypothetical protein
MTLSGGERDLVLQYVICGGDCAGWVWRTLVGTDVWIADQSAWRHQNLPCGWRSWAGPCVFMGLTGFFGFFIFCSNPVCPFRLGGGPGGGIM